jgi:hypothetical protein
LQLNLSLFIGDGGFIETTLPFWRRDGVIAPYRCGDRRTSPPMTVSLLCLSFLSFQFCGLKFDPWRTL